ALVKTKICQRKIPRCKSGGFLIAKLQTACKRRPVNNLNFVCCLVKYETNDHLSQGNDYQAYDCEQNGVFGAGNITGITARGNVFKATDNYHDNGYHTDYQ